MTGRLAGKTALITAAGQGMGTRRDRDGARRGERVRHGRQRKAARGLRRCAGITGRKLDVLDDAAVAKLVGGLPPLQILFNCAGFVHHGTILDCEPKDWDFSMNLNVRSM